MMHEQTNVLKTTTSLVEGKWYPNAISHMVSMVKQKKMVCRSTDAPVSAAVSSSRTKRDACVKNTFCIVPDADIG